jgi:hypothetical protein
VKICKNKNGKNMQNMSNLWESAICNKYVLKYAKYKEEESEQKYDMQNMHSPLC